MKAGAVSPNRGNVPAPAGMSEAWRGFWRHGTNLSGVYECRGTSLISDWYPCHGAETFKMRSGAVSRYKLTTEPGLSHGTGVLL